MAQFHIDVHLGPDEQRATLERDALEGLTCTPKSIPSKYFYDEVGADLFDQITRLDEYYLTRRETEIFLARADDISKLTGADTFIELGSGTSNKTTILLDAFSQAGSLQRYIPFDVDEKTMRAAAQTIMARYHDVSVHAVVGDFESHLSQIPHGGRRVLAFIGSTIGNLTGEQRKGFLAEVAEVLEPGDAFLLGADLMKDQRRLELAYDDPAGVTAEFNRNVLRVLNKELQANFDVNKFQHVARFDEDHEWMQMSLRSTVDQEVRLSSIGLDIAFAKDERLLTEISAKFRRESLEGELAEAGLEMRHWWTDTAGDFGVSLSFR
ncbi:MAG: L-histidine N(alpha)-methyltransferase [Actinomycetota bacterium]